MESYSLYELNEYLRRIIALNLPGSLWVSCEIAQVNESRGHYYFNLIEKDDADGSIIAQSEAVLWQRDYRKLRRRLPQDIDALLQNGITVLLKIRVDFHERYGLKLMVEDIDPAYTLGKLELQRRETILALKTAGLVDKNRTLPLPMVLQRIAVISSATAAGYKDYMEQLSENAYGYQFKSTLLTAAMQGQQSVPEVIARLDQIALRPDLYDCVVIIRGGGARLDLMAFDQLALCEKVAACPLPVLAGIGHEVDETVLDLVAHQSLKTPTAVAAFIVQHNLYFESQLVSLGQSFREEATALMQAGDTQLQNWEQVVKFATDKMVTQNDRMLEYIEGEIPRLVNRSLQRAGEQLDQREAMVNLLHPDSILKRGFSLTLKNGALVKSKKELKKGEEIETILRDGKKKSIVK